MIREPWTGPDPIESSLTTPDSKRWKETDDAGNVFFVLEDATGKEFARAMVVPGPALAAQMASEADSQKARIAAAALRKIQVVSLAAKISDGTATSADLLAYVKLKDGL